MSLLEIFNDIKSTFGGLWHIKDRGATLEIITPYSTTNNRFVSVFLSQQNNEFIVSDGGWINNGTYEVSIGEESCFLKVFSHFKNTFDIKETSNLDGITYYYLKTSNAVDIPSKLFDLTLFIQNIVSVSEIEFEDKEEKATRERFDAKANEYLKSISNGQKLHLSRYLHPEKKDIRFNAIYFNTPARMTLINYVTGSTAFGFSNSISKANMLFQIADDSDLKAHINSRVSIIDTSAEGYVPEKLAGFLYHLEHHTGALIVNWHERERLQAIFD